MPDPSDVSREFDDGGFMPPAAPAVNATGAPIRVSKFPRLSAFASKRVTRGQLIGRVGSTGSSTGPHIHFGPDDVESGDLADEPEVVTDEQIAKAVKDSGDG